MANLRRRGSSLFPGLLLLFVGMMLLLHNYRGLGIVNVLGHWWPLILIFWGAIKLYERMAASRSGDPGAAAITGGEVFLVLGLLSLLGIVVAVDYGRENIPRHFREWGNSFDFDLEVAPKSVPADARITIRNGRGNIACVLRTTRRFEFPAKKTPRPGTRTTPSKLPSTLASKSCRMATATKSILLVWAPAIRGSAWTWTWRFRRKPR